jgi:2-C-methyl-D-erythritol 4-phosphate cytidylyltransferase
MMNPDWLDEARELVDRGGFNKVVMICPGGDTRNETTKLALAQCSDDDIVLFHDAVRPLIDERIIADCVSTLHKFDAVDVVIPSADTLVVVDEAGLIKEIPNRSTYRRGQTPQGFRVSILRDAYVSADKDPNFQATDDCSVVLKYRPDVPIATVNGTEYNMKVTEPIDLFLVDKLFQVASLELDERSTDERKALLSGKSAVVFGGSEGIGQAIGQQLETLGVKVFSYSRSTTNTDVADLQSVEDALEQAAQQSGSLDLVINTAGILRIGS